MYEANKFSLQCAVLFFPFLFSLTLGAQILPVWWDFLAFDSHNHLYHCISVWEERI